MKQRNHAALSFSGEGGRAGTRPGEEPDIRTAYRFRMSTGRKGVRGLEPEDVPVEGELRLKAPAHGLRLAEAVPLAFEHEAGDGEALPVERVRHQLGLVRGDHAVVEALEEDDRAAEPRGVVQGRAGAVHLAVGGPLADQPIEIAGLELVGVGGEHLEVADPVVARAGPERVVEGEGGEGGIAARAAAADREAGGVGAAGLGEVPGARDAVLDIDHPPLAVEPLAVRAAVSGAAPVVDVEDREAAARPELDRGAQGVAGRSGRTGRGSGRGAAEARPPGRGTTRCAARTSRRARSRFLPRRSER